MLWEQEKLRTGHVTSSSELRLMLTLYAFESVSFSLRFGLAAFPASKVDKMCYKAQVVRRPILVSEGCQNKMPQDMWLGTTEICSFTFLVDGSLKPRN